MNTTHHFTLVALILGAFVLPIAACASGDSDEPADYGSTGGSGTNRPGGSGSGGSMDGAAGATAGNGGAAGVCIPGDTKTCVGPGACQGGQVCEKSGLGFGPCDCGSNGGSGSGNGASGASGSSASGGTAGTSGGSGGGVPKTCAETSGNVGCCGPNDVVYFCNDGGTVEAVQCTPGSCGWLASKGWYDCDSSGGVDPSSTYPKVCGAAGSGGSGGSSTGGVPDTIDISLVSALIGPGKSDKTQWDGFGDVPDSVTTGLAAALGAGPYAPVLGFMTSAAIASVSKPDPFGYAQVNYQGTWELDTDLANENDNTEDTFTPQWPENPGWQNVPYSKNLRVRIVLQDEDISNHDDMGKLEINAAHIEAAWAAQKVHQIRVADQTYNQVLYFGISVTASQLAERHNTPRTTTNQPMTKKSCGSPAHHRLGDDHVSDAHPEGQGDIAERQLHRLFRDLDDAGGLLLEPNPGTRTTPRCLETACRRELLLAHLPQPTRWREVSCPGARSLYATRRLRSNATLARP